jgi:hypothetical protein
MAFEDWFKLIPPPVASPSTQMPPPVAVGHEMMGWIAIILAVCAFALLIYVAKHFFATATTIAFSFFQFVVFYAILRFIESRFLAMSTQIVQTFLNDFIFSRFSIG